jgi:hypothetical protein
VTLAEILDDPVDAEALAYEQAAVEDVTGELAAGVAAAIILITSTRAALAGAEAVTLLPTGAADRLAKVAKAALRGIVVDLRPALERQAAVGYELGRRHAVEADPLPDELDEPLEDEDDIDLVTPGESDIGGKSFRPDVTPPADDDLDPPDLIDFEDLAELDGEIADVIDGAEDRALERLDEAVRLAETLPMSTKGDIEAVTARATAAVTGARRDTEWVATRAQSLGTQSVATEEGLGLIWLAERNACLDCLALSGQVAYGGEDFPDVTFADRPASLPPVPYPPRHPHCRCDVRPYDGPPPSDDLSAEDVASVLAREARRSVVRGWSAYDSEPARLRAADQLVAAGANLPRSVIDRALRNLAAGEFSQRQIPRTTLGA